MEIYYPRRGIRIYSDQLLKMVLSRMEEIPIVLDVRKILNYIIPRNEGRSIDGGRVRSGRNHIIATKNKS